MDSITKYSPLYKKGVRLYLVQFAHLIHAIHFKRQVKFIERKVKKEIYNRFNIFVKKKIPFLLLLSFVSKLSKAILVKQEDGV